MWCLLEVFGASGVTGAVAHVTLLVLPYCIGLHAKGTYNNTQQEAHKAALVRLAAAKREGIVNMASLDETTLCGSGAPSSHGKCVTYSLNERSAPEILQLDYHRCDTASVRWHLCARRQRERRLCGHLVELPACAHRFRERASSTLRWLLLGEEGSTLWWCIHCVRTCILVLGEDCNLCDEVVSFLSNGGAMGTSSGRATSTKT